MQNSRAAASFLRCGHAMHSECYRTFMQTSIACPLCRKSIVDPKYFEASYDAQIRETPMPEEYKNKLMTVQCNDCLQKSNVPFHIFGGKCKKCKSYNTTRVGDELIDDPEVGEDEEAEGDQNDADNVDDDWETDGDE